MKKRGAKASASSARAASSSAFGTSSQASGGQFAFSNWPTGLGTSISSLSYLTEQPDLSQISDPNVVVSFKNLSKKDGTTKAKALEEIQAYFLALQDPRTELEEAVLEAYVKVYPRLSIENERRVRQAAHQLLGHVYASCGKRAAKSLARVVGPWVAGRNDPDRSVSKAAQEALNMSFASSEKQRKLFVTYQQQLLKFIRGVVSHESAHTLSDERNTSTEDAESKYNRVLTSSLAMLTMLLATLSPEEREKEDPLYIEIIGNDLLWGFTTSNDSSVYHAINRLLIACLQHCPAIIESHTRLISSKFLYQGLAASWLFSVRPYLSALVRLTKQFPTVWTTDYSGKKSVQSRLENFLKKGSRRGPRDFWTDLCALFSSLPNEVLPTNAVDASALMNAVHSGILAKEEPRANLEDAWMAYLHITAVLCTNLDGTQQQPLAEQNLLPIVTQYVKASKEDSTWDLPATSGPLILSRLVGVPGMEALLQQQWSCFSENLSNDIKSSLPEQSKEHSASQNALFKEGMHWAEVKSYLLSISISDTSRDVLRATFKTVFLEAISVLNNRNGKPFGTTGVLTGGADYCPALIKGDAELRQALSDFLSQSVPTLIDSPSRPYVIALLYKCRSLINNFDDAWRSCLKAVLSMKDDQSKHNALHAFLASLPSDSSIACDDPQLQQFLEHEAQSKLTANSEDIDWSLVSLGLSRSKQIFNDATVDALAGELVKNLSIEDSASAALDAMQQIARQSPKGFQMLSSSPSAAQVLPKLLFLAESPDDAIATKAANVRSLLQRVDGESIDAVYDTIKTGIHTASENSIKITTLVELALQIVRSEEDLSSKVPRLFPDHKIWEASLQACVEPKIDPTLAIVPPLGPALYLVADELSSQQGTAKVQYDHDGLSAAFRMAHYTAALMSDPLLSGKLQDDLLAPIYRLLVLTSLINEDQMSSWGANRLWIAPEVAHLETFTEATEFQRLASALFSQWNESARSWWNCEDDAPPNRFDDTARKVIFDKAIDSTPMSFYHARAFERITRRPIEAYGLNSKRAQRDEELYPIVKVDPSHPFQSLACAATFADSRPISKACNEAVADILDPKLNGHGLLRPVVLVNCILTRNESAIDEVSKQRRLLLVNRLCHLLEDALDTNLTTECLSLLSKALKSTIDMYGPHWKTTIDYVINLWSHFDPNYVRLESNVPLMYASFQIYSMLRSMCKVDGGNEDLDETMDEAQAAASSTLIHALTCFKDVRSDENHLGRSLLNQSFAKCLRTSTFPDELDLDQLFPQLDLPSAKLQLAVSDLLHAKIPKRQEQISIDAVIENKDARLPEALLEMVFRAPTIEEYPRVEKDDWEIPHRLRSYLLAWSAIFDHFSGASFKVKADYTEHLKETALLPSLLDFMFDFLGHSRGKPVNAASFSPSEYRADEEPLPYRDVQWLLVHLYFLSLKHLAPLAKAWWIECRSRQKATTVETWTEKNISPLIIESALGDTTEWDATQESTPADERLKIKVNTRAKEVIAGFDVDEQTMSIAIRLPGAYPLQQATVEGINRVAVDERKWNSWLRNCQGVITFSNGSIPDGLSAWRKNVVGALRGQSECAICYSIISADKQLPTKKCNTCRHLFHSLCLYRWFKSSNASTCPLCRNPFNYG